MDWKKLPCQRQAHSGSVTDWVKDFPSRRNICKILQDQQISHFPKNIQPVKKKTINMMSEASNCFTQSQTDLPRVSPTSSDARGEQSPQLSAAGLVDVPRFTAKIHEPDQRTLVGGAVRSSGFSPPDFFNTRACTEQGIYFQTRNDFGELCCCCTRLSPAQVFLVRRLFLQQAHCCIKQNSQGTSLPT